MRIKTLLLMLLCSIILISSGCSSSSEPPDALITIDEKTIELTKGSYHWEEDGLFSTNKIIADAAAPYQIAKNLDAEIVNKGSIAQMKFSDNSKPQLQAYLWEGERRGKELSFNGMRLTLPSQPGKYIIEVMANWSEYSDASYTFVIEIK